MNIKPIETSYAGCRFRSRLEARWAVFFDAAGIRWEYEPQGFVNAYDEPYLPDFYLPDAWSAIQPSNRSRDGDDKYSDRGLWVEVKGSDEQLHADYSRIGNSVDWRATPCSQGLLLLGPIPRVPSLFPLLYWREGVIVDLMDPSMACWDDEYHPQWTHLSDGTGGDIPEGDDDLPLSIERVRQNYGDRGGNLKVFQTYYDAARQARFEHGQSGALVR